MNRPLAPHLQIYKLPLTGLVSISHRITGIFLTLGLLLFVYILFAIARGEGAFIETQEFLNWPIIKLVYWGFIYSLCLHLVHGIRHLLWDIGVGFGLHMMNSLAILELGLSLLLAVIVLLCS